VNVSERKAELTILSEKGQVVMPAKIRSRLGLKPKTKFLVYECNNSVIMKKFEEPDLTKELEAMYKRIDKRLAKYGEISNDDRQKKRRLK
jgi:AbrB family looped-hinge helix DNA binding protein